MLPSAPAAEEDRHKKTPRLLRWLLLPRGPYPTAAVANLLLVVLVVPVGKVQGMGRREVFAMAAMIAGSRILDCLVGVARGIRSE